MEGVRSVLDGGRGIVAAGHQVTAEAGAAVLREGGNAVDAALAAVLASFVAEPLLTGLGAGGHMIVAGDGPPAVLDFFVEAPAPPPGGLRVELEAVEVSFGDAQQVFHLGPASCGIYGVPAGICAAAARWGSVPLEQLAEPAERLAKEGVPLNAQQAYVAEILQALLCSSPACAEMWAPEGRLLGEGDLFRSGELSESIGRLGREGAKPFYEGDIAVAVQEELARLGGWFDPGQLAAYRAIEREPIAIGYRDREVFTNPPPSAGGILLAYALALLDRGPSHVGPSELISAMRSAQAERSAEFMEGLRQEGFLEGFLSSRLGSTTHISVIDREGMACGVTTTNGEGSAVVVPGVGIHLNNVMGERDLSPLGFHLHPPGVRMPSMMAPTAVLSGGEVEMVLGSAGSNRIRSALLQTVVGVVDLGLTVPEAVSRPRVHFEDGVVYHEPGVQLSPEAVAGASVVAFRALNLFFGGVQAVQRKAGHLIGAGDPRRGGVVVEA